MNDYTQYRTLIDPKLLKHLPQKPCIHWYVKDEEDKEFRHLFSIPASKENFEVEYAIGMELSEEFDQVSYMDESDMTFEHFTNHDCDGCHCGQAHLKINDNWFCYDCAEVKSIN